MKFEVERYLVTVRTVRCKHVQGPKRWAPQKFPPDGMRRLAIKKIVRAVLRSGFRATASFKPPNQHSR
jgi:hypothetical protein